jgi:hypothetical protein
MTRGCADVTGAAAGWRRTTSSSPAIDLVQRRFTRSQRPMTEPSRRYRRNQRRRGSRFSAPGCPPLRTPPAVSSPRGSGAGVKPLQAPVVHKQKAANVRAFGQKVARDLCVKVAERQLPARALSRIRSFPGFWVIRISSGNRQNMIQNHVDALARPGMPLKTQLSSANSAGPALRFAGGATRYSGCWCAGHGR